MQNHYAKTCRLGGTVRSDGDIAYVVGDPDVAKSMQLAHEEIRNNVEDIY